MNIFDKQRNLVSGGLPSRANAVTFESGQIEELGGLYQSQRFSNWGTDESFRTTRFGSYEQIFMYDRYGNPIMVAGTAGQGEDSGSGDGGSFGGDVPGSSEFPNPCPSYGEVDIGAVATTMGVGETQTFSVSGGNPGATFTWELSAGGGDINSETGEYTAPDSNPNCELNPTISLLCDGVVVADIKLGLSAVVAGNAYYDITAENGGGCTFSGGVWWAYCPLVTVSSFDCEEVLTGKIKDCTIPGNFFASEAACEAWIINNCTNTLQDELDNCDSDLMPQDVRSPAQKAAGCCPGELA